MIADLANLSVGAWLALVGCAGFIGMMFGAVTGLSLNERRR